MNCVYLFIAIPIPDKPGHDDGRQTGTEPVEGHLRSAHRRQTADPQEDRATSQRGAGSDQAALDECHDMASTQPRMACSLSSICDCRSLRDLAFGSWSRM